MEGGVGAEVGDGQQGKAVAMAGSTTGDHGGSGPGGPRHSQPTRFRPRLLSWVLRRQRSGVGAKISRFLELDEGSGDGGEATAHAAGQDGTTAGAGQNGAAAGAGHAGLGADQDAVENTSKTTTP
uniref:Uncharacterized protein n=1 Tax=Triticum aestivum TaxID=4565 RepID=A0A080YUG5_WHEAT|nr:unnamed protein product [Triticum aestivum]